MERDDDAFSLFMSHTVMTMRRVHGIVLLAAWCLLAPIAISLMALTKAGSRGAGLRPRVFLPHAALQVCVLVLSCVGLALGLLLPVADATTPHKCVGYLTFALALFPLTAALWRPPARAGPGPGSTAALRRRRLWEGCHRGCGLGTVAAAFVDGALGVRRTGMRPRCVPAAIMGSGLAVLTFTYGFKLVEATVLRRARGEKKEGGGGGRGEEKRAGGGHGGGDVEKARPLAPFSGSSPSSKGTASSKVEEEKEKERELDDSARAVASVSRLSPKELGEPGLGGCRGGGRRKGENEGSGGDKEEEKEKENEIKETSGSFDTAAGCF